MNNPYFQLQVQRPMPPTPRAMACHAQKPVASSSSYQLSSHDVSKNRASATYIPRPVSGSSRQVSLTRLASTDKTKTIPDNREILASASSNDNRSSRSPHKSFNANDGMPPVSVNREKSTTAQHDCSMPASSDFTEAKVRLPSRNYSKPITQSPERTMKPALDYHSSSPGYQNSPRSPLPSTKGTVQTSLMRPIYPPLPRSQTVGNIACFGKYSDFSPAKPAQKIDFAQDRGYKKASRMNVPYAPLDARAKENGIDRPNRIHRTPISDWQSSSTIQRSLSSQANNNRSLADESADSQRQNTFERGSVYSSTGEASQEAEYSTLSKRPPLCVNGGLADSYHTQRKLSPCSTPRSTTIYGASSSFASSFDLKQVYHPEDTPYWLGRFMAISDRLRQTDCDSLLQSRGYACSPTHINSKTFEDEYDELESSRTERALLELQGFCKSPSASRSFDRFLSQLLDRESSATKETDQSISAIALSDEIENQAKIVQAWPISNSAPALKRVSSSKTSNQIADITAHGTIGKTSNMVDRGKGLTKSKTTSNLTSGPDIQDRWSSKPQWMPKKGVRLPSLPSKRQASNSTVLSQTRTRAIEERESRRKEPSVAGDTSSTRKIISKQPSSPIVVVNDSTVGTRNTGRGKVAAAAQDESAALVSLHSEVAPNVTATALENGHGPPPPALPDQTPRVMKPVIVDGEKVLYNRKRGGRQLNGNTGAEMMRKMVGAGIREVRKMSRRVGSIGWSGSSDDLVEHKP